MSWRRWSSTSEWTSTRRRWRSRLPTMSAGAKFRYLGVVPNVDDAVRQLVKRLMKSDVRLSFCYEAGPCGYGLQRLLEKLGQECIVIAPSMMPRRPGDHVKTDRRDAMTLARLLRAGELTAIWVPDEAHEAVRDLIRTRRTAKTGCDGGEAVGAQLSPAPRPSLQR